MFRKEKTKAVVSERPEIWVDGQQMAPFQPEAFARASSIIARRTAAHGLGQVSIGCAGLAFGLESGRWKVNPKILGGLAFLVPSRLSIARGLARLSRVHAMAAELVDHQSEPVTPLAIDDLNSYMAGRRQAALIAEEARKKAMLLREMTAKSRGPAVPSQVKSNEAAPRSGAEPAALTQGSVQAPVEPGLVIASDVPPVTADELAAIRAAVASAPEPPPPLLEEVPLAVQPVSIAVQVPVPETPNSWYMEEHHAARPPVSRAATASPAGQARTSVLGGSGSWIGGMMSAMWRGLRPVIARFFALVLGWTSVLLALPYGIGRALYLHFNRHDLRYFD